MEHYGALSSVAPELIWKWGHMSWNFFGRALPLFCL